MFAEKKKKRKGDGEATHEDSTNVELFCLLCGKRWMLNKEKNVLAQWLAKLESARNGKFVTSSST
jgi:hypothetical protein